MCVAVISQPG